MNTGKPIQLSLILEKLFLNAFKLVASIRLSADPAGSIQYIDHPIYIAAPRFPKF